jgi:hypothetical protein
VLMAGASSSTRMVIFSAAPQFGSNRPRRRQPQGRDTRRAAPLRNPYKIL